MYLAPLIAIDIGSYSIKIIEVVKGKAGSRPKIRKAGEKILPRGAVTQGLIRSPEIVQDGIDKLLKEIGVSRFLRRAAISLGGGACIINTVSIKTDSSKEIEELVYERAGEELESDLNDLYFDWFECPSSLDSTDVDAVIAGAKREIVDKRVEMLKNIKLRTGAVDCNSFALCNAVNHSYGRIAGTVALTNIGASSTQIVFICDGVYLYTRDIGLGGEHFTRAISESEGCELDVAEKIKIDFCTGKRKATASILECLQNALEKFASELKMNIDFFLQSGVAPVDQADVKGILLCGGGAKLTGLADALVQGLDIEVESLNPFLNIEERSKASLKELDSKQVVFANVFGLGLRDYSY